MHVSFARVQNFIACFMVPAIWLFYVPRFFMILPKTLTSFMTFEHNDCQSLDISRAIFLKLAPLIRSQGSNFNQIVIVFNSSISFIFHSGWGTSWGMEGYIMMSRKKDNQCGITNHAVYLPCEVPDWREIFDSFHNTVLVHVICPDISSIKRTLFQNEYDVYCFY